MSISESLHVILVIFLTLCYRQHLTFGCISGKLLSSIWQVFNIFLISVLSSLYYPSCFYYIYLNIKYVYIYMCVCFISKTFNSFSHSCKLLFYCSFFFKINFFIQIFEHHKNSELHFFIRLFYKIIFIYI